MSFLWSGSFLLLLLIPLIAAVYIWLLRRRNRFAVRFSSLSLVREAAAHQSRWRRHLPFVFFLLALTSLVFALSRPVATVSIPSNKSTVILALDVSRSMCSNDIPPNRLEAAKDAAQNFVQNRMDGREIGIVAFAGFAELIQPPTTNVQSLTESIENLTPARRTAIGSAILRSIDAIAEIDDRVSPSDIVGSEAGTSPLPDGEYVPHIIVLLTDGASNAGPFPLTAAEQAAARGIRVYTIGYGTTNGNSVMDCNDAFSNADPFGGGGFGPLGGGGGFRRDIDEATLKEIASVTDGEYYVATSAGELEDVFQNLPSYVVVTEETIEIGAFFTAFAALLAILAMIFSMLWRPLS
jgi:Ca-activated chloride channel family protein